MEKNIVLEIINLLWYWLMLAIFCGKTLEVDNLNILKYLLVNALEAAFLRPFIYCLY